MSPPSLATHRYHATQAGGVDVKTTSWGGSVLRDDDGKLWMFAAEMANRCTLGQWTSNSQVVTAVSDSPEGPYVRQAIAIPPWSHNPDAVRAPDGTWVIFTLGPGMGKTHEKNCSSTDTATVAIDRKRVVRTSCR